MIKAPLVVILGAGFSQALDIAGTMELTDIARRLRLPAVNLGATPGAIGVPLADLLWKALSAYYDNPNFETMIHGIEALLAFQTGTPGAQIPDVVKPVSNAFMDVTQRWTRLAASTDLQDLASKILQRVAWRVAEGARDAPKSARYADARAFVARLASDFDVTFVNLNYDDALDVLLPESVDGYPDGDGVLFDWSLLRAADQRPRNLHVHGSVKFGIKTDSPNRSATIVKYRTAGAASHQWGYTIDVTAQSGERVLVGPIITGLRKADKTLWAPYGHYLHYFVEQLFCSSRIVAIGYGGADNHVNQWLLQWLLHHRASARFVAITKFDDIQLLPNDAHVFRIPAAVMGLENLHDFKLIAGAGRENYSDRVMTVRGGMVDGNGMPDAPRLETIVSFLNGGVA